jgi:hypothetical protein
MTIIHHLLKQMPAVGRPQRTFLSLLFNPILALRGRVNFRTLSRYGADSERPIARQSDVLLTGRTFPSES